MFTALIITLIESGINVNAQDEYKCTALMLASEHEDEYAEA